MPIQPDTVVRTKIRDLVRRFVRTPHLTDSIDLFGGGFLNSLFAMQLVLFVEKEFGVVVESDDLKLENFNSIDAMVRFVESKSQSASSLRATAVEAPE